MYLMQNILYCRRLLNFPLRMEETETSHHCTGKQAGWASVSKPKQGKKSLTSRRTSAAAKHRQN